MPVMTHSAHGVADPRFATNVARVAHRELVDAMIAPVLAALDREAAVQVLTAAGIACGRLSDLGDLHAHPQARRITVDSPTGPVEMMGRGVRFEGGGIGTGPVPAKDEQGAPLRHGHHPVGIAMLDEQRHLDLPDMVA